MRQDARKGVLFQDFPPVLQLQLKRFEYDFQRNMMVKVLFFIQLCFLHLQSAAAQKGCLLNINSLFWY